MDVLPEDRSQLPKFNSDVCKWHLFFSNLTEDVYQVVNETFTMDYKRELRFQQVPEENEGASNEPSCKAIPETDAVVRDLLAHFRFHLFTFQWGSDLSIFLGL